MTLRKATKQEQDEITAKGIIYLSQETRLLAKFSGKNAFEMWKDWINDNYDFGEKTPSLRRIVNEVLGID